MWRLLFFLSVARECPSDYFAALRVARSLTTTRALIQKIIDKRKGTGSNTLLIPSSNLIFVHFDNFLT